MPAITRDLVVKWKQTWRWAHPRRLIIWLLSASLVIFLRMPRSQPSAHCTLHTSSFLFQEITSISSLPGKLLLILQGHNFLWSILQPRGRIQILFFSPPTASIGVLTTYFARSIAIICPGVGKAWCPYTVIFFFPLIILHGTSQLNMRRKSKLPCCYCTKQ